MAGESFPFSGTIKVPLRDGQNFDLNFLTNVSRINKCGLNADSNRVADPLWVGGSNSKKPPLT